MSNFGIWPSKRGNLEIIILFKAIISLTVFLFCFFDPCSYPTLIEANKFLLIKYGITKNFSPLLLFVHLEVNVMKWELLSNFASFYLIFDDEDLLRYYSPNLPATKKIQFTSSYVILIHALSPRMLFFSIQKNYIVIAINELLWRKLVYFHFWVTT